MCLGSLYPTLVLDDEGPAIIDDTPDERQLEQLASKHTEQCSAATDPKFFITVSRRTSFRRLHFRGALSKLHIVPKFVLQTRSTSKSLTPFVVLARRRCVNSLGRKQRPSRPLRQLRLHRPRQKIRSWRSESIKVCYSCFFQ